MMPPPPRKKSGNFNTWPSLLQWLLVFNGTQHKQAYHAMVIPNISFRAGVKHIITQTENNILFKLVYVEIILLPRGIISGVFLTNHLASIDN